MEEFDWETAVHEAGHAVIGLKLGWELASVSAAPPCTCFNRSGRETADKAMSMAAAGPLAELISAGEPWDETFDADIRVFFERLGDDDVSSQAAEGLYATLPSEDLRNLVYAMDGYETREEGIAGFQEARTRTGRLLNENWDLVERLGRALQRDPSGKSDELLGYRQDLRGPGG